MEPKAELRTKELNDLISFIREYGQDFLDDGTKEKILKSLEAGNKRIALEILNSMDRKWIERTKELKKFLIFTESSVCNDKGVKITKPFYKSNYMDSLNMNLEKIPTLRKVIPRYLIYQFFEGENDLEK